MSEALKEREFKIREFAKLEIARSWEQRCVINEDDLVRFAERCVKAVLSRSAGPAEVCAECKTRGIPNTSKWNWPLCDECLRKKGAELNSRSAPDRELREAAKKALIPLAALVVSGECVQGRTALAQEVKAAVIEAHGALLSVLAEPPSESAPDAVVDANKEMEKEGKPSEFAPAPEGGDAEKNDLGWVSTGVLLIAHQGAHKQLNEVRAEVSNFIREHLDARELKAKRPAPEGMGWDVREEDIRFLAEVIADKVWARPEFAPDRMRRTWVNNMIGVLKEFGPWAHPTSESGTITPWNCPESHFGIVDCKSCGLTFDEQPDFPAIVPERFKAIDPNHGPSLKECNESLAKLISDVWAALEPTGEYEGEKNLVEFAKSIRVAKESAEWSLGRIPELEQKIAALKAESGRDDDFWQSEYVRQSKEILQLAGMPDDFKTVGVDHAIESLRKRLAARVEEQ